MHTQCVPLEGKPLRKSLVCGLWLMTFAGLFAVLAAVPFGERTALLSAEFSRTGQALFQGRPDLVPFCVILIAAPALIALWLFARACLTERLLSESGSKHGLYAAIAFALLTARMAIPGMLAFGYLLSESSLPHQYLPMALGGVNFVMWTLFLTMSFAVGLRDRTRRFVEVLLLTLLLATEAALLLIGIAPLF